MSLIDQRDKKTRNSLNLEGEMIQINHIINMEKSETKNGD